MKNGTRKDGLPSIPSQQNNTSIINSPNKGNDSNSHQNANNNANSANNRNVFSLTETMLTNIESSSSKSLNPSGPLVGDGAQFQSICMTKLRLLHYVDRPSSVQLDPKTSSLASYES